jgi:hypothetical protein
MSLQDIFNRDKYLNLLISAQHNGDDGITFISIYDFMLNEDSLNI